MTMTMTLTTGERAWIQTQATATELVATVAYAEVLVLYAAGLGVQAAAPVAMVRRLIREVLHGEPSWHPAHGSFCSFVRRAIRTEIGAQVAVHARLRAGWTSDVRLASVQVGALAGLDGLMHWAGEMAGYVRQSEPALMPVALDLIAYVRTELDSLDDRGLRR
jgi:hypothetical protein